MGITRGAGGLVLACALLLGCGAPPPSEPTPRPTLTLAPPTPSPTPAPLSLPPGYTPAPPERYGLSVEALAQPGLEVERVAAFTGPGDAVLLAFWGRVTRQAAAAGTLFEDPTALAEAFLAGYTAEGQTPQPFTPAVGQRASGFTLEPGVTVIAFERPPYVAVLVGITTDLDLLEVAQTLDQWLSSHQ